MTTSLTALALTALLCFSSAAFAETYHIRLEVTEHKFKVVTVKPYARCTPKQLEKLPALSFGTANVENSSACLGKAGCSLTLRIPEGHEGDVQYYALTGKTCTATKAEIKETTAQTGYTTDVDFPTRLLEKNTQIPAESDHGKVSDIRRERIFTTVKITYLDKPTVDVLKIGENTVNIYY